MFDQVSADADFLRALAHLKCARDSEAMAAQRSDCSAGLIKSAQKQRALAMGLVLAGLDEPIG